MNCPDEIGPSRRATIFGVGLLVVVVCAPFVYRLFEARQHGAVAVASAEVFSAEEHRHYFEPGTAVLFGTAGRDEEIGCRSDIVTVVPATPFFRKLVIDVLNGIDVPLSSAARKLGRYVQCTPEGLFRVDGLPPGRYLVVAFVNAERQIMQKEVEIPVGEEAVPIVMRASDIVHVRGPGP